MSYSLKACKSLSCFPNTHTVLLKWLCSLSSSCALKSPKPFSEVTLLLWEISQTIQTTPAPPLCSGSPGLGVPLGAHALMCINMEHPPVYSIMCVKVSVHVHHSCPAAWIPRISSIAAFICHALLQPCPPSHKLWRASKPFCFILDSDIVQQFVYNGQNKTLIHILFGIFHCFDNLPVQ